jgi:NAD(P)-dependent dehydrogenase (short-subunit alcohol dehydrogenase family)
MNQIDLRQRHAVITGGGQGIGLSIATRLLRSGASISLWDCDEEMLEASQGNLGNPDRVSVNTVDVSEPGGVMVATRSTISKYGKIDILVANAGIAGPNHKSWEYPVDTWKQVIDINLLGVFLCCRAIVPHMLERFEMNLDTINKARRVDSHTKPISDNEMEEFENSYRWVAGKIAKIPALS